MAHQPVSNTDLDFYKLPTLAELREEGSAGKVMHQIIQADKAGAKLHSDIVICEACRRYIASLQIAADPKAYAAFAKDSLVTNLKRRLKDADDTFRAMWQATMDDSKLASKRFKRLEHLWSERKPVAEVKRLLKRHGWEKPIPGITKPKTHKQAKGEDSVSDSAGEATGNGRDTTTPKQQPGDRLSTVTIKGIPRHLKITLGGDFSLRGRIIKQVGGELTIADAEIDT